MSPKGKASGEPKTGRLEIRTSQDDEEMLEYCCKHTGLSRTDIIRLGIKKVYEDIKNK